MYVLLINSIYALLCETCYYPKTSSDIDSKRDGEGQLVMSLLATFLKEGKTTHGVLLSPDYVRRIPKIF